MSLKTILLGTALLLPVTLLQAQESLRVDQPWSRAMPPSAPAAAVYFELHNATAQDDRLIAASTPVAGKAELHEHVHVGGVMKMREVAGGVKIAAGQQESFRPGGYHVMLLDLPRQMAAGEHFPLTLRFEKAGELTIDVPVQAQAPQGNAMPHGNMHSGH